MNKLSLLHNIKYIFGRYPLYLIVFCIQLPVSYYEVYSSYYDPFGVLPAILILLILGLALFAVSRSLLCDTQPAGLLALIGLIFLFPKAILTAPVYPLIGIAGLFLVILPIAKRKKTVREALRLPRAFSHAINTVAVTMLIAVGAQSSIHAYEVAAEADDMTAKAYAAVHQTAESRGPVSLPHIVHIVLDGYSRADVLQSEYGFDNKPFLDALRQRGFRISEKATTPFNQTLLTMSSIFSLGPFTDAISSPVTEKNDTILRRALARSQRHGAVSKILRDLGYDLQATPTTYFPLQWDQIAGHSGDTPISNRLSLPGTFVFVYDLLQSSWVLDSLAGRLFGGSFDITAINFELIKQVSNRRFQPLDGRPLFVYEHILAPHPPFNISANGEPRPLAGLPSSLSDGAHLIRGDKHKRAQYRDGYVEKLRYINGAILEQIDALKESLSGPIVIILHGDHGGGLHFDQHEKSNTCLKERFSPLLAVYATDPAISNGFTSDFNLVNIYRVVFRRLLDVDLPNLPNRSTYISSAFDESVMLEPGELEVSCAASRKTWTAERRAVPTPHVPPISASR